MAKRRSNGCGTLFRRNGWYYFKGTNNGKTSVRSLHTQDREQAELAMKDFALGADLNTKARIAALVEMIKPPSANPTFDEAWTAYATHPKNVAKTNIAESDDHSKFKVFGWWLHGYHKDDGRMNMSAAHPECHRLNDITQAIANEFVAYLKGHRSNTTTNRFIRILKRIWAFNDMEKNPWEPFAKLPEIHNKRRALTDREIAKCISEAKGELKVLFALGPYTGLRMSDCAKLKWSEVDLEEKIISTYPFKTKLSSGVLVNIPISKKLLPILQAAYAKRKKKDTYLTPGLATMPVWKLTDIVQEHFAKCGLAESVKHNGYMKKCPVVGFHSFRSTFVTNAAEAGAPLAMVQSIVGHVDPELTQLYYRSDVERARKYIDKI